MKKILSTFVFALLCLGATAQTVTLMFTGKDARNQYVKLNRVVITNLTQNWQETIYYPDTILMMGGTGVEDFENASGMRLSQNVPNPFDGATDFELQTTENGNVTLEIVDINGRAVAETQCIASLQAGTHHFRATLATAGTYLLTARCGNNAATIKMVNNGGAGENAITYFGEGKFYPLTATLKGGKGSTNKPFAFGDNMIYMGYAMINGKECVSQNVEKRQLISETITLSFDNYPPTVTTAPVTEITSHSAMSGGEVLQDGGSAVITKGLCWNTKPNPTVNDSHIAAGSGLGSFVSTLTGLTYGTTYYVRAYAENGMGVSYGNEQSFTTVTITPPVVTTAVVSNVTNNSATCGGTIQDMGSQITGRGVCWSKSPNPTVENSCTNDGIGAGTFTSLLKNLDHSTFYYVRAYATTVDGTFYGDEKSFTTAAAQLPVAVTNELSDVGLTTASGGGTVIDMGTLVTARGVCWSTSHNPTIEDAYTNDGTGAGTFTSQLTDLEEYTTYYVRAYASNSDGTAYGEEKSFTTLSRPRITTATISGITFETAISGGNVSFEGTSPVTVRGVCWGTSQNPTTSNARTADGSGTGGFTSNLTRLYGSTTYYVRAYATNKEGTAYGEEISFTTLSPGLPTVSTADVDDIQFESATCGGSITAIGGATITARGVCWSTSHNPTINNNHTADGMWEGAYTSRLTDLTDGTVYYVRAYATNSAGTAYGEEKSFKTLSCGNTLTDYDKNVYNIVRIGEQCWMKENLRTTKYADGTPIDQGNSTSTTMAYWYYPNNNESNKATYGLLYNWKALMRNSSSSSANPSGVQGICPNGWHVPSDAEWTQLTDYVSSKSQYQCNNNSGNIAKALASATTEWSSSTNTCAVGNTPSNNNASGFGALPAGSYLGFYLYFGYGAFFWSATEASSEYAYYRYLSCDGADVYGVSNYEGDGVSVRCLRD